MKFEEAIVMMREEVDAFEKSYREGMKNSTDEIPYPDEMESGDWYEQLTAFIETRSEAEYE